MNKLKKLLLISSALLLSTANNTFAETATGTITTSGTVTGTCAVSATPLAFGTLSQTAPTSTTSTVTATCSSGTVWTVTNAGSTNKLYLGGAGNALTANATTGTISYPITVTSGGGSFVSSPGAGGSITGTVAYANVTPVTAGTYGGTVTLTITYE